MVKQTACKNPNCKVEMQMNAEDQEEGTGNPHIHGAYVPGAPADAKTARKVEPYAYRSTNCDGCSLGCMLSQ